MTTVGILGGGQLGQMLCEAAKPLNINTIVVEPGQNPPASTVADTFISLPYTEHEKILEAFKDADVITIEIESIPIPLLQFLKTNGKKVHPDPETLVRIQNKYEQKQLLHTQGIPVAPFVDVADKPSIARAAEKLGYPLILKACTEAYDGRGNAVINGEEEIDTALSKLNNRNLYVEQIINFDKELSLQVARTATGDLTFFPLVQTVHKNSICHLVLAPAQVSSEIERTATEIVSKAVDKLVGAGVFSFELFLTKQGDVMINEIAPRVHNSGHYSIEGATISQFTQHLLAITQSTLETPTLSHPASVMINILGERQGPAKLEGEKQAKKLGDVYIHNYGKAETKPERKMGHITVVGKDRDEVEKIAQQARQEVSI